MSLKKGYESGETIKRLRSGISWAGGDLRCPPRFGGRPDSPPFQEIGILWGGGGWIWSGGESGERVNLIGMGLFISSFISWAVCEPVDNLSVFIGRRGNLDEMKVSRDKWCAWEYPFRLPSAAFISLFVSTFFSTHSAFKDEIFEIRLIHMCDMNHSYVWHDSPAWNNLFVCLTWLIQCATFTPKPQVWSSHSRTPRAGNKNFLDMGVSWTWGESGKGSNGE